MTNPEFTREHEQPATPEQASALLTEVGTITTLQGTNYGDRNTYGTNLADMPSEVAKHLPEAAYADSEIKDSVYITQKFDRTTGQPLQKGVVGMVSLTRAEKPDKDLTYAAHANYHITTNDGGETYGVERHVTNTEHGQHKVRQMREQLGRASIDPAGAARDMLQELTGLRDRINESRPVAAMGMFTVTEAEAQQVIDLLKNLNGKQE